MTATVRSAWGDVPATQLRQFAERARNEIPVLAQDILREIRREYPGLPVILDESGEPMSLIGIRRALEHFVEHLATGLGSPHVHPRVFQEFGRGELLQGRSLDSLQAIYRLGVRLAWRRLAEIGQQAEIPAPAMYELAESGFQYLDGLVAESVRGYAEAAARQAGERLRLQRRLLDLLLTDHGGDVSMDELLAERAARIGWPVPQAVAVAVLVRPAREAVPPAVGPDVLLDMEREQPLMVVPDPDAAGRAELLRRATAGWTGAIGPPVPLADAAKSLRWAQSAITLMQRGLLPSGELLHCQEHTEALVLLPPEELIDDLGRRLLAPLDDCGASHGRRLAETLLAWLETRGGAPEIAARLSVHPQTVRYRLRQIRELWGDGIDDPDRRFELELVLRAKRLRGQ
ncbi:PucR family transcriptional regulator [Streptomyces gobiensis]|uniref:PucR family transcriptional regulator n=1 Tax=Streptomyces gobiensis TaxID=2875706 RepID=UPI001E2FD4DB|nr:helix-turn-helix domain-containing protein [Streptomyces gobiensis]UGY91205.1 helix-turn-helix domain-containing protein [Streptomyces gobiensis]